MEANLAWACYHCNLHKGPNLTGIDPETSLVVQLFNPRLQRWADQFAWSGVTITGLSATGRATVQVLAMNSPHRLQLRSLVHRTPTEPPAETDDPDA